MTMAPMTTPSTQRGLRSFPLGAHDLEPAGPVESDGSFVASDDLRHEGMEAVVAGRFDEVFQQEASNPLALVALGHIDAVLDRGRVSRPFTVRRERTEAGDPVISDGDDHRMGS